MTALIRLRDALGRDRMVEVPVDSLLPRDTPDVVACIVEDEIERARR